MSLLERLAARSPIDTPTALVVAHPDDETLGLGGSLYLFRHLLLIHVTDGAPRRLTDAGRSGFGSADTYAQARATELALALAMSECSPTRYEMRLPDQDAVDSIASIRAGLDELFRLHHIEFVLTHAYEGGHPDHDAVAMAVKSTSRPVYEFPLYSGATGQIVTQTFLPADTPTLDIALLPSELTRKRSMLSCFGSQTEFLTGFDPAIERIRLAPCHDFSQPPHPSPLLYERWGWLTFDDWRQRASRSRCPA